MTDDIAAFERLVGVDRNLAQKLFDLLDELLRKAGWDNNMNAALDSLFGDINPQRLQSVRNSWAQALQNADVGVAGVGDVRQMLNPNFGKAFDNWTTKYRNANIEFRIATTTKALRDVGVDDKK